MDLRARDYRKMAAKSCKPFSGILALITLVYVVISTALSYTFLGIILLGGALTLGYIVVIKNVCASEKPRVENLFDGFDQFGESVVTFILHEIFIILWSLLFIIPGIIKGYSYAMTFYILRDEKISGTEAITKSREIMNGNKWKLFCLEFSYIGWILLSILTFGILLLWVIPKMETARYKFYLHITGKDVEVKALEETAE